MTVPGSGPELTEAERRLLYSMAHGARYKQVAHAEGVHVQTVKARGFRAVHKLGAATLAEAVAIALLDGLIGRYEDCGTHAAYQRHRRRREHPDALCLSAKAEHDRAYRARNTRKKEQGT